MNEAVAGDGNLITEGTVVTDDDDSTGVVENILGEGAGWRCAVEVNYGGGDVDRVEAALLRVAGNQDWIPA